METKKKISLMLSIILILQVIFPILNVILENELTLNSLAINQQEDTNTEYETLYNELTGILDEKNWSQEGKNYVTDAFNLMWNSYDNVYEAFVKIGFPDKETWIEETYLQGIRNVNTIEIYQDSSELRGALGTWNNYSKTLSLVHFHEGTYKYEDFLCSLIHETMHATQHLVWSSDAMFNMTQAYVEGGAAYVDWVSGMAENCFRAGVNGGTPCLDDGNYHFEIFGVHPGAAAYNVRTNIYMKLLILLGYDNVMKVEHGEISVEESLEMIRNNYGEERANKIIDGLLHYATFKDEELGIIYDLTETQIIDLENTMLEIMQENIQNLDCKEDVQRYLNLYYIYKKSFFTQYVEEIKEIHYNSDGTYYYSVIRRTDYTSEKISYSNIEDLLISKVKQYNALPVFSTDEVMNSIAIKSILYLDYTYFGPVRLFDECYIYTENNNTGTLKYRNTIIDFNKEGQIDVKIIESMNVNSAYVLMTLKNQEHIHAFDNGVITTNPTCEETGVKTYTCTECGETKTEEIPAMGHVEVIDEAIEATCSETGLTQGKHCSRCGKVIVEQQTTSALGHVFTDEVIAPTCTKQGYTIHTCSRCGGIKVDTYVNALRHNYVDGKCTRCQELAPEIEVTSTVYNIDTVFISDVLPGTTIKTFLNNITTDANAIKKILDKQGNDITDNTAKIGTGMQLEVKQNGKEVKYTLVVIGDLNGDGEMGDVDVLRLARYRAGLDNSLSGAYLQAANIYKDDNFADDIDLLKMVRILVGLDSLTK